MLPLLEQWREQILEIATRGLALLQAGYQRAPLLVVVLSALLILPAAALISYVVHTSARKRGQRAAEEAAERRAEIAEWTRGTKADKGVPAWPSQAWISVEGRSGSTVAMAGPMLRIGRHQDNDICLPDSSVHRYHAVIHRTEDYEFFVTDVSGKDGNGLRVNGTRQTQAQLADGDLIELGRARLKFESEPV